jgi:hypothetical protein
MVGGGRPLAVLRLDLQLHADVDNGLRASFAYGNDRRRETGSVRVAWEHYF